MVCVGKMIYMYRLQLKSCNIMDRFSYSESRGGLMGSAPDPRVSCPDLSPSRGQCVVFLGKTLCSDTACMYFNPDV